MCEHVCSNDVKYISHFISKSLKATDFGSQNKNIGKCDGWGGKQKKRTKIVDEKSEDLSSTYECLTYYIDSLYSNIKLSIYSSEIQNYSFSSSEIQT